MATVTIVRLRTGEMSCIDCLIARRNHKAVVGIEVPGMYDGVAYWHCQTCDVMQSRSTGRLIEKEERCNSY